MLSTDIISISFFSLSVSLSLFFYVSLSHSPSHKIVGYLNILQTIFFSSFLNLLFRSFSYASTNKKNLRVFFHLANCITKFRFEKGFRETATANSSIPSSPSLSFSLWLTLSFLSLSLSDLIKGLHFAYLSFSLFLFLSISLSHFRFYYLKNLAVFALMYKEVSICFNGSFIV